MKKKFPSYGEAVSNYLEIKDLKQVEVVDKIIEEGQKKRSLEQQMSKWLSGEPISRSYMNKINRALGISVEKDQDGLWRITRTETEEEGENLETPEGIELLERIKKYASSSNREGAGNQTRRILLAFRDQLKSQRAQTDSMIQVLNALLDDDSGA